MTCAHVGGSGRVDSLFIGYLDSKLCYHGLRVKVSWPPFLTENAGYSDNASYSDMTFEQKVSHYPKQNLLAQSLHPIAYEKKPEFRNFRERTGLSFATKEAFKKADLDDRQALYITLAKQCWSPDWPIAVCEAP